MTLRRQWSWGERDIESVRFTWEGDLWESEIEERIILERKWKLNRERDANMQTMTQQF